MSSTTTATARIAGKLRAFHTDPTFAGASKRMAHAQLTRARHDLKRHCSRYFDFYFTRERMRAVKARGQLQRSDEERLAQHGDVAATAYGDAVQSLKQIEAMFQSSGMLPVLNRHMGRLCEDLDDNPRLPALMQEFRDMGVPDSAIDCMRGHLRKANFDLLRYNGNDGTFEGAVRAAEQQVAPMRESIHRLRTHGLTLIEGSGAIIAPMVNALVAAVAAVTAAAVAIAEAVAGAAAVVGEAIGDAATAVAQGAASTAQGVAEAAASTAQGIADGVADTAHALPEQVEYALEHPPRPTNTAPTAPPGPDPSVKPEPIITVPIITVPID